MIVASGVIISGVGSATCSMAGLSAEDVKEVSYEKMIELNSANVTKITAGMAKDEVTQIMGNIQSRVRSGAINNPWKIEIHDDMEILHYITSGHPPFTPILANQATPVVFREADGFQQFDRADDRRETKYSEETLREWNH